jgi:hypothetical protein
MIIKENYVFGNHRTSEQLESNNLSDAELLNKSMTGFSEVIW